MKHTGKQLCTTYHVNSELMSPRIMKHIPTGPSAYVVITRPEEEFEEAFVVAD